MFSFLISPCIADKITFAESELKDEIPEFKYVAITTLFLDIAVPCILLIIGTVGVMKGRFPLTTSWAVLGAGIALGATSLLHIITGKISRWRMHIT